MDQNSQFSNIKWTEFICQVAGALRAGHFRQRRVGRRRLGTVTDAALQQLAGAHLRRTAVDHRR